MNQKRARSLRKITGSREQYQAIKRHAVKRPTLMAQETKPVKLRATKLTAEDVFLAGAVPGEEAAAVH